MDLTLQIQSMKPIITDTRLWVTTPDDMVVPAPITNKQFEGGLYAAYMIPFGNFEEWGWLIEWVQNNTKYRKLFVLISMARFFPALQVHSSA